MFAGPVCHFELVRAARRRRLFAGRFLFGLLLLAAAGIGYAWNSGPNRPWYNPGVLTITEMSNLGQALFFSVIAALAALVLGLTPALVADAVAAERQSKTLHYLMASQLSSAEIVLGKLLARLMNVGAFALLVLPIMSLLTLLGGASPAALILAYTALAASAYFLGSLALLCSVLARRPRDAIGNAYGLAAVWLFGPGVLRLLGSVSSTFWAGVIHEVLNVGDWIWPPSPLGLVTNAAVTLGGNVDALWREVTWMVGMQAAYGTVFAGLAAWQLRPAFRRHESRGVAMGRVARAARRWFRLRPCGDDPVFWKETQFALAAGGPLRRLVRALVLAVLAAAIAGAVAGSWDAFAEVRQNGYGFSAHPAYQSRMMLNLGLRYGTGLLFVVWMAWLGSVMASGISSEREQDTWISLLSTPLEARDILRGKMLGPLRNTAHFGATIAVLWLIGLFAGAVHPLGFFTAVCVAALYTWFVISLGTYLSFKSQSTWRARLWTQALVLAPHFCCTLVPSAGALLGVSLFSYAEPTQFFSAATWPDSGEGWAFLTLAAIWYFGGIAAYAGAAYFMTAALFRGFDAAAGRARRSSVSDVVLVEVVPVVKKETFDEV